MKKCWCLLGWVVVATGLAAATEGDDEPVVVVVASSRDAGAAGEAVTGSWRQPAGAWDGRAVVMLHGFADDRDGPADIAKRLAGELARAGIASLRINFRGEGDKARTRIESTFALRLADAAAAREWLRRRPGVAAARVGAWGFSLGAATAIVTAGAQPAGFRSLAVWSSPSGDLWAYYQTTATARTALREGVATEEVPGWKAITTRREFYESFRGVEVDEALGRYPGAFLSVRGSEDFLPAHEVEFMRIARGRPAEACLLAGADHIFKVFAPELGHAERAVRVTVEWFGRTL